MPLDRHLIFFNKKRENSPSTGEVQELNSNFEKEKQFRLHKSQVVSPEKVH